MQIIFKLCVNKITNSKKIENKNKNKVKNKLKKI